MDFLVLVHINWGAGIWGPLVHNLSSLEGDNAQKFPSTLDLFASTALAVLKKILRFLVSKDSVCLITYAHKYIPSRGGLCECKALGILTTILPSKTFNFSQFLILDAKTIFSNGCLPFGDANGHTVSPTVVIYNLQFTIAFLTTSFKSTFSQNNFAVKCTFHFTKMSVSKLFMCCWEFVHQTASIPLSDNKLSIGICFKSSQYIILYPCSAFRFFLLTNLFHHGGSNTIKSNLWSAR